MLTYDGEWFDVQEEWCNNKHSISITQSSQSFNLNMKHWPVTHATFIPQIMWLVEESDVHH